MSEQISLTRDQYLNSIRDAKHSATELAGGLTMTQMTWQPRDGERWSVAECFDHLATANGVLLDAMAPAIGQARPGPDAGQFRTGGFLSKKLVHDAEPPPKTKLPSPAKLRPRPTLNPEGIMPRFIESIDRLAALAGSSAGKDLNAVRFQLPLIPLVRISAGSGLLLVAAHIRRHLWQAEQVIREADFPR